MNIHLMSLIAVSSATMCLGLCLGIIFERRNINIEWQSRKDILKKIASLEKSITFYWHHSQDSVDALEKDVEMLRDFILQEPTVDDVIFEDITEKLPLVSTTSL
jgi:hypothetical protein